MKWQSSLGALLLALTVMAWLSNTQAYSGYGETTCEAACEADHEQCVDRCSTHSNPVECDAACRETEQICTRECH